LTSEVVTGGCRKLHNEDLRNLYILPNIKVIKLKRMRWTGHVAHEKCLQNFS